MGNVTAPSGGSVRVRGRCFSDLPPPSYRNNAVYVHTIQPPPLWPVKYG